MLLVFAMTGTGFAAIRLVKGDSLIKKNSLSGNRLKSKTVATAKIANLPGARVYNTGTQDVDSSTLTPLESNAVEYNNGGVFNLARPTALKAPVSGTYLVTASVLWSNNGSGVR